MNKIEGNKLEYSDPFEIGVSFTYFSPDFYIDMVMRKINYYLKVLSIFTNMFERTLERVNKGKDVKSGQWRQSYWLNDKH